MTRIVSAPQDVEAIHAHIARDSTHYADLVVERLVAALERLSFTATTVSFTACGMTSSRSRRCFTELASSDSTDGRDIRASNIRWQPTAARFARSGG